MNTFAPFGRQQGASLLVVLILLLLMTVMGLAVLRGTTMEERMTANLYDRSLGFQAVESALRQGEALARATAVSSVPANGCSDGVCSLPDPTAADRWLDTGFNGWRAASNDLADDNTPMPDARYIVEYMGMTPAWPSCDRKLPVDALCLVPRFRITAISDDDGRSAVLLQTTYNIQ
ncbi:PilX N-terminal domain-containing pilus assembly protein [Stenotrophomonas sp. NLF4-10]|uniref:pilus assembly PilX family protein n=1 Tax=Stenotrophomonas sp. NLF4-10 TaxID=2918754 RepID=UPI001EFBD277|nr:PilX N-terminal domain-containing pilus assembly protein [Stenotrophomonas sp. NLF4-10]MCG8276166.1 PilX N-terminal domain-containing pilus assembly protein [Stenotrophomonas sp. NLF4-10]